MMKVNTASIDTRLHFQLTIEGSDIRLKAGS